MGNAQQKFKTRMQQHFAEVKRFVTFCQIWFAFQTLCYSIPFSDAKQKCIACSVMWLAIESCDPWAKERTDVLKHHDFFSCQLWQQNLWCLQTQSAIPHAWKTHCQHRCSINNKRGYQTHKFVTCIEWECFPCDLKPQSHNDSKNSLHISCALLFEPKSLNVFLGSPFCLQFLLPCQTMHCVFAIAPFQNHAIPQQKSAHNILILPCNMCALHPPLRLADQGMSAEGSNCWPENMSVACQNNDSHLRVTRLHMTVAQKQLAS